MRLLNMKNELVYRNLHRFLIKWEAKSKSKIQFQLKQLLKPMWQNYIVYEEFPVYSTRLKVDFVNASLKIAIELSPESHHGAYNAFFHKNKMGYIRSIGRDCKKADWLIMNKFQFLELTEEDLKNFSREYIKEKFDILL